MLWVQAELYKCLLYGPGDFFLAHKDTEKAAGMVATLAICLPRRCAKGVGQAGAGEQGEGGGQLN